jgi:hypothetical protein
MHGTLDMTEEPFCATLLPVMHIRCKKDANTRKNSMQMIHGSKIGAGICKYSMHTGQGGHQGNGRELGV